MKLAPLYYIKTMKLPPLWGAQSVNTCWVLLYIVSRHYICNLKAKIKFKGSETFKNIGMTKKNYHMVSG